MSTRPSSRRRFPRSRARSSPRELSRPAPSVPRFHRGRDHHRRPGPGAVPGSRTTGTTSFNPQAVTATPVPACASMTVEYTTDEGGSWTPVPGMDGIAGATIFNGAIPDDIGAAADGIRFVYTADSGRRRLLRRVPARHLGEPEPVLHPRRGRPERPTRPAHRLCGVSRRPARPRPDAHSAPACDDVDFTPVDAGQHRPDRQGLGPGQRRSSGPRPRSGRRCPGPRTATPASAASTSPTPRTRTRRRCRDSVFDTFDLARIDPITAARRSAARPTTRSPRCSCTSCPRAVPTRRPGPGSTPPVTRARRPATAPSPATRSPPPTARSTIGFRLTYIESPTRADRLGTPSPAGGQRRRRLDRQQPPHPSGVPAARRAAQRPERPGHRRSALQHGRSGPRRQHGAPGSVLERRGPRPDPQHAPTPTPS